MRNISRFAIPVIICLLFSSCGSKKKNTGTQPEEPVFGIYKFGDSDKIQIQLNDDSTVVSKISNPKLKKIMDAIDKIDTVDSVNKESTFTFRNDSIFINWKNGRKVSSKFVKKDGIYSFRIGSTTYKRKL